MKNIRETLSFWCLRLGERLYPGDVQGGFRFHKPDNPEEFISWGKK